MAQFIKAIKKMTFRGHSPQNKKSRPQIKQDTKLSRLFDGAEMIIADIGARGGVFNFGNLELIEPWTHYVAFEPDKSEIDQIETVLQQEKKWKTVTIVPYAISSHEGHSKLFITHQPGLSSLIEPDPIVTGIYDKGPLFAIDKEVEVPTIRLDNAAKRFSFTNAAMLKLDTQGSELDIMQSGINLLKDSLIAIYIEVMFQAFYKQQPLFGDVDCFMREQGFSIAALNRTHLRRSNFSPEIYSHRDLVWGHALYLRPLESILSYHAPPKLIGRALALYASFDFFDHAFDLLKSDAVIDLLGEPNCNQYAREIYDYATKRTEYINQKLGPKKLKWYTQLDSHISTDKSKPFMV